MSNWQPAAYKQYRWIVADPELLGGKLAIRGTRLSVSLLLECLANGMTVDDMNAAYGNVIPSDAGWRARGNARARRSPAPYSSPFRS